MPAGSALAMSGATCSTIVIPMNDWVARLKLTDSFYGRAFFPGHAVSPLLPLAENFFFGDYL